MMAAENDFGKQLSRFLGQYLPHERNLSPNTILAYRDTFVSYISYMKSVQNIKADKLTLKNIDRDSVIEYLNWLTDKQGCSVATRNNRLAAIRAFASYLQYSSVEKIAQWQKILSIKRMKQKHTMPIHFSKEGIKLLLQQPDPALPLELKHLAMLTIMYDTGCRVQELSDLTVESLKIQAAPFTIKIFGKGRKTRIVPLSKQAVEIVLKYQQCFRFDVDVDAKRPLFGNASGRKMTRAGVTYILKKYANMARKVNPEIIPDITSCHQLRHSRAMHLLQSGVNLVYIRDFLGHVSVQTTEVYARADSKQKREAIEQASDNLTPSDTIGEWVDNKDLITWLKGLGKD